MIYKILQREKRENEQLSNTNPTKTRNEIRCSRRVNRVINSTLKLGMKSGAPEE
jgi:hypothetical protein